MIAMPINFQPQNGKFVTLTYKNPVTFKEGWTKDIPKIVQWLNRCGEYSLVPEIGDNGNFHFHYIIKIKDNFCHNMFLNHWVKNKGFIKSKVIVNYLGSFIYIRKQSLEVKQTLEQLFKTENEELISIITRSTSPLALQRIKKLLTVEAKHTKKINELNQKIKSIKGTIYEYFNS